MLRYIVLASAIMIATVSSSVSHAVSWGPDVSRSSVTAYQGDTVVWQADQDSATHTIASIAFPSGQTSIAPGSPFSLHVAVPPGYYEVHDPQNRNSTTSWLRVLPNLGIPDLVRGSSFD
jgi:plastocyanin